MYLLYIKLGKKVRTMLTGQANLYKKLLVWTHWVPLPNPTQHNNFATSSFHSLALQVEAPTLGGTMSCKPWTAT